MDGDRQAAFEPPNAETLRMERLVRRRVWGLVVSALLLLLGGAAVLVVPYRHSVSTARAYQAASDTREIPAVVKKLENTSTGRGGHYWVDVEGPASVSGRIQLDDSGPVLSKIKKGDRIGVVVWHGRRTDITFGGRVQETSEAPTTEPGLLLGAGLGMLEGTVLALYAAVWSGRRVAELAAGPPARLPLAGKLIAGGVAVTVASAILVADDHDSDVLGFAAAWCLLATVTLVVWAVRRWIRDRRH
jgi:hypothetical protein